MLEERVGANDRPGTRSGRLKAILRGRTRRVPNALALASGLFVLSLVVFGYAVPAAAPSTPQVRVTAFGPPGLYFTVYCAHGSISWGGSSVCHDQSGVVYGFCGGPGYCSVTMTETPDSGHTFTKYTTAGGACMGTTGGTCVQSSTSTSVNLWGYANGVTHQTGTVTLVTT